MELCIYRILYIALMEHLVNDNRKYNILAREREKTYQLRYFFLIATSDKRHNDMLQRPSFHFDDESRCFALSPSSHLFPLSLRHRGKQQLKTGSSCALLRFNLLPEGQIEIRNSYDSLPTFVRVSRARSRAGIWGGESAHRLLQEGLTRLREEGVG